MFIDTHTRKTMEQSICEYFKITENDLTNLFYKINYLAHDGKCFDGDKFGEVVDDFITTHKTDKDIDKMLFFHLGRRLNIAQDDYVGYNLADLLTKETALSTFLKKYEVEFYMNNGHIEVFHRKDRVSLEDTWENSVAYLRSRLGYNKGREDYCFNGFAFKDLLYRNSYARALSGVPEFIGSLEAFLKESNIRGDYSNNSTYFCYEYCVPIEKVIFDKDDKLSTKGKQRYFIYQVLKRLYDYSDIELRYMFDHENPILRLADNDTMDIQFFISKEVITNEMLKY